jgi:hypothetical protein
VVASPNFANSLFFYAPLFPIIQTPLPRPAMTGLQPLEFATQVDMLIQEMPEDADVLYLGYNIPRTAHASSTGKIGRGLVVSGRRMRYRVLTYVWQLHAYLLPPRTARALLSQVLSMYEATSSSVNVLFYQALGFMEE